MTPRLLKNVLSIVSIALVFLGLSRLCAAATFFFEQTTPYLSSANIPAGFYADGSPTALEDLEDGSLDFGITANTGIVIDPTVSAIVDSVDADDGTIDGSGLEGHSWFSVSGAAGVTMTFPSLVKEAGIVWTDGQGETIFEAFGPGMVSLGTIGPVAIADNFVTGETDEDRFFGVKDTNGIIAVKLSTTTVGGIEVDHIQYGAVVPEPSSKILSLLAGIGLAVGWPRRSGTA